MPAARHLYPAQTVPSSRDVDQDGQTMSELAPWPEQVREPPPRRLSGLRLIGRIAVVSTFAALVALLTILAKPLWQSERTPLNAGSQTSQASKPSDRLTANNAPANTTPIPAAGIAAAPRRGAVCKRAASTTCARAASVALTELARTTELLSRGDRQRSSVSDIPHHSAVRPRNSARI